MLPSCVPWRIAAMQKPCTGRPFARPFPTDCTSKALPNGSVDSLIYLLALEKKSVMHQTLQLKKAIIVLMFDRTCLAFFSRVDDSVISWEDNCCLSLSAADPCFIPSNNS
jgi:hypothetical protein